MTGTRGLPQPLARAPRTRSAIRYAEQLHAGQLRSFAGDPFIRHPREVGRLLLETGASEPVIAAGILHDVIEKTSVRGTELRRRFGPRVAELVLAVTEDPSVLGYAQRKAALRYQVAAAGPDALAIFAADKVSKVRELRMAIAQALRAGESPPQTLLRPRRLAHYRRCLGMLEELLSESVLVAQLRRELARLEAVLGVARGRAVA